MIKVFVTPEEFNHMNEIYATITALTTANNGVPALVTLAQANKYEWNFETLKKMRKYGAIDYCQVTGSYNLPPITAYPPSYYFSHALLDVLTV